MNNCTFVGRVTRTNKGKWDNGKEYAIVCIEVADGGKYPIRIDAFTTYQIEEALKIPVGRLVCATGRVGARVNEHQGKHYANLNVNGMVRVVEAPPVKEASKPSPTASAPKSSDSEDDCPF